MSSGMPREGEEWVSPRKRAAAAASVMCYGGAKSGSPTARLMTSIPAAIISFDLLFIAMVADGGTALMFSERGNITIMSVMQVLKNTEFKNRFMQKEALQRLQDRRHQA